MNNISFYPLILILVLFSCSSSTQEQGPDETELSSAQQQVKVLEKEVLDIHDEVMPLMSTMISLKEQLEAKNQTLSTTGDTKANDQVILNDLIITNLDQGHEEMMSWMRNYHQIDISEDTEANLDYLLQEKSKLEAIQEQTNNAIKSAEEALRSET